MIFFCDDFRGPIMLAHAFRSGQSTYYAPSPVNTSLGYGSLAYGFLAYGFLAYGFLAYGFLAYGFLAYGSQNQTVFGKDHANNKLNRNGD